MYGHEAPRILGYPLCPNDNWTTQFKSLVVTGVTFQVSQDGNVIVTCNKTGTNLDDFTFTKSQCTFA